MSFRNLARMVYIIAVCLCCVCGSGIIFADEPRPVLSLSLDGPKSLPSGRGDSVVKGGQWVAGKSGQAWQRTGEGDHLKTRFKFPVPEGTVEIAFKLTEPVGADETFFLFDYLGNPSWYNRFLGKVFNKDGSTKIQFLVSSDKKGHMNCSYPVEANVTLDVGKWYVLAATWKNLSSGKTDAELRLYLDGVEIGRLNGANISLTKMEGGYVWLGNIRNAHIRANKPSPLVLDDFKVWDKVLSASSLLVRSETKLSEARSALVKNPTSIVTIRPAMKKPVMDGKLDDEVWKYSQYISGFRELHVNGGRQAPLQTGVWLTYDKEYLYTAWRCEMLSNNPHGHERKRDEAVFYDESLEFFVSSPDKPEKLFHFIGNAFGSIYDEAIDRNKNRDRNWNGNWDYTVQVEPGVCWTAELRVPLSEVDSDSAVAGKKFLVNFARNGFEPQCQSLWSYSKEGFSDRSALAELRLADAGPVINKISFPPMSVGDNDMPLAFADSEGRDSKDALDILTTSVSADSKPSWMPWRRSAGRQPLNDAATVAIANSGTVQVNVLATGNNDDVILRQNFITEAQPPLAIKAEAKYSSGYVAVTLDTVKLKAQKYSGTLSLNTKEGKAVSSVELPLFKKAFRCGLPLKGVEAGDYFIAANLKDQKGESVYSSIPFHVYTKPKNVNPEAGKGGVIAPWNPLVTADNSVKCWNRIYTFDNGPFPVSIKSGPEDIFAEAPRLVWRLGAKTGSLSKGEFDFTEKTGDMVSFAGKLQDKVLAVDFKGELEFDGALFYKMNVSPKAERNQFDELALEFYFKPDAALYLNYGHAENVTKEKNLLPRKLGERLVTKFIPMIFVQGEERGLQIWHETDEGWTPYDRDDTFEFIREKDALLMRIKIKEKSSFKKPLRLSWGIQATPVKPLPKNRDHLRVVQNWPGGPLMNPPKKPMYYRAGGRMLPLTESMGAKVINLHTYWAQAMGMPYAFDLEKFKEYVDDAHSRGLRVTVYYSGLGYPDHPDAKFYGDQWFIDPATGTRARSWEHEGLTTMLRCPAAQSFDDWLCGNTEVLLRETGVDGLYFDWPITSCRNHSHGCGYLPEDGRVGTMPKVGQDEKIIGMTVKSTVGKWSKYRRTTPVRAQRELWKRLYRIVKTVRGPEGLICVHIPEKSHAAIVAFSDSVWHSEDIACNKSGDWMPPAPWFYRIFMSARQLGFDGELITAAGRRGYPSQEKGLALSLVHNEWPRPACTGDSSLPPYAYKPVAEVWKVLDAFGADKEDTEWCPYWKPEKAVVSTDNKKVLASCWLRSDKALICVANWTNENRKVVLTIRNKGLQAAREAIDQRTGEKFTVSEGSLEVSLNPASMRLLLVENK